MFRKSKISSVQAQIKEGSVTSTRVLVLGCGPAGLGLLVRTLFCDANGRIIDQVLIINIDGQLLVISDKGASQETRKKLVTGVSWDENCEVLKCGV